MMKRYLLGIVLLIISSMGCARGCLRPTAMVPSATAPLEARLQYLAPWIDEAADVLIIIDVPAVRRSTAIEPWLAYLRHGPFDKFLGAVATMPPDTINLAVFSVHLRDAEPDTVAQSFLLLIDGDARNFLQRVADEARTFGHPFIEKEEDGHPSLIDSASGIGVLLYTPQIIVGGNAAGRRHFVNNHTGRAILPPPGRPASFPSRPSLAWGWIRMEGLPENLPAVWRNVQRITFSVDEEQMVHVIADLQLDTSTHTTLFAATVDGLIAMATLTNVPAAALQLFLRSLTIHREGTTVHMEADLPPDILRSGS